MSDSTRNTVGQVFSFVGGLVGTYGGPFAWIGWVAFGVGTLLQVQAQTQMRKEAERRARAGNRAPSIKGNVRSSHEHHNLVFGKARVGGIVVTIGTADGPAGVNQQLFMGIAHSLAHPGGCEGITDFWIDDTRVTAAQLSGDPNTDARNVTSGVFSGLVRIRHFRGTGTQAASTTLTDFAIDSSTDYRRGIAWSWVRLTRSTDQEAFQNAFKFGIPNLSVELKGIRCYDPRLDTTEGGSGAHRHNDPLTWAWTDNPILCASTYDIMDVSDGGVGTPPARIDWASVGIAASICDEEMTTGTAISWPGYAAGDQPRFRCNGVLSTADKRSVNRQKLLDSCLGTRVRVGSKYKYYASAARTPTAEISAVWLAGDIVHSPRQPLESLYNAVRINHDDAAQDYKTVDAPPATNSSYETQDGGERLWRDMNLPMVSDSHNAQYLAKIQIEQSRRQMTVTMTCNLRALDVEAWETVTLNQDLAPAGYNLSGKVFRIQQWDFAPGGIQLSLVEDDSSLYVPGVTFDPELGTDPPVGPETPPAPSGVSATGTTGGIVLKFTPPASYLYERIQVERATSSGGTFTAIGYAARNATTVFDPQTTGATFYYKLRARTSTGTLGPYSAEVSAAALIIDADNPSLDTEAPTVPGNLTLSQNVQETKLYITSTLKAEWTASTDNSGLLFYELEYWIDPLKKTAQKITDDTEWTLFPAEINQTYSVRVRAVDYSGNVSAWTATQTILIGGDLTAPANVTDATATGGLDKVLVEWVNPTDTDFIETQVYRGASSGFTPNDATNLVTKTRATAVVDIDITNGTAYYYKFKTRDVSGNVSTASAAVGPATPFKMGAANFANYFETLAITNAYISTLDAAKITSGFIAAGRIQAGSITATKLDVSELSSITADFGEMTAGIITGVNIRTAASGQRVQMNSTNGIRAFNTAGDVTAKIDIDGSGFFGFGTEQISWNTAGVLTVNTLRTALTGQRMEIRATDNEMHFYGERTSGGAVEDLCNIGINTVGGDDTIIHVGGTETGGAANSTRQAIYAIGKGDITARIRNDSTTGIGLYVETNVSASAGKIDIQAKSGLNILPFGIGNFSSSSGNPGFDPNSYGIAVGEETTAPAKLWFNASNTAAEWYELLTENSIPAAKAWVLFDGSHATPDSTRVGFNITSITDNGTGDYTVNLDQDFNTASYVALPGGAISAGGNTLACMTHTVAAGTYRFVVKETSVGTATDPSRVHVLFFGHQFSDLQG